MSVRSRYAVAMESAVSPAATVCTTLGAAPPSARTAPPGGSRVPSQVANRACGDFSGAAGEIAVGAPASPAGNAPPASVAATILDTTGGFSPASFSVVGDLLQAAMSAAHRTTA